MILFSRHPVVIEERNRWLKSASLGVVVFCLMGFSTQISLAETEIPLVKHGGVYTLPVQINGVITLNFILDSGASEVCIPADVVRTLIRAGTITQGDFLPGRSFSLADGSVVKSQRFIIRELELGGYKISNVPAVIASVKAPLLLGQSLLGKLDTWTLDNKRHVLIFGRPGKTITHQPIPPARSPVSLPTTSADRQVNGDFPDKPLQLKLNPSPGVEEVRLYDRPSVLSSIVVGQIPWRGGKVKVLSLDDEWVQIELASGEKGWVRRRSVSLTQETGAFYYLTPKLPPRKK